MRNINIENLSLRNSDDFFLDFAFAIARLYYIYPISRDYAHSEWYSLREDDYDKSNWKNFADDLMYAHIYEYNDDYIDISDTEDYQTDNLASGDYDFDLLELELDEMMAKELFELDEDDNFEEEDFFDEYERTDIENIPNEILNDPVKLLEWLRKIERSNDSNTTL